MRNEIYTIYRSKGSNSHFVVQKLDKDYNATGHYTVSIAEANNEKFLFCDCYAGSKETCRHREMLRIFDKAKEIDSGRAYWFDKNIWFDEVKPIRNPFTMV
jgi:hypothetical protein